MMEIYDAPMLEPDVDVPMHATFGSSPKTWNEATMDDDSYETADVEVDMEGYGDGVEYEMEDESSGYETQPAPVVDVDFVDAHVDDAPHADAVVTTEHVLEHDMTEHSLEHHESPLLGEHVTSETVDPVAEASFVTAFEGDVTVAEPSAPEPAPLEESHFESAPAIEEPHADSQPEPFDAPSEAHPEYLAERSEEAVDGPYEEAAGGSYEESAAAPYEEAGEHVEEAETAYGAENVPYDEAQGESYTEEARPEEAGEGYVASPEAETNVYQEPEGSLEQEYEGDPHEIDDGMFIEPPPAVLLDLSTSSDDTSFCLFNEPSASSRAGSSSGEHSTPPRYLVLLQEQPTLYYAPLSEVFSELRSDENVQQHMPDIAEGELMLDAYDLQLVVSEDNVLASEVSLHDLNSLHDGTHHDGPLRLRLRCSSFRFLTRYYALREQVYRLDLAEGGTTYDAEEAAGVEQHDQDGSDEQFVALAPAAETHIQEQAEYEAQQDGQAPQEEPTNDHDPVPDMVHAGQAQDEGDEGQYDDADADAEGEDDEEQDQPTSTIQQEADAPVHEVSGEDAHALETTYDGPYNDPVDASSDVQGELDADDIHAAADTDATIGLAPETTEYAEETVPHEDDEEEGDEVEEAAAEALDDSAPVDEAEEVYEGEEASEGTLEGDSAEDDGGHDPYAEAEEGELSVQDGYPDDEGAEAGEEDDDEHEQSPTDPAIDNGETSAVFSSSALPTLANGGESQLSGLSTGASEYWDEASYEGETIAPAVSDGSLKRRYDDLEEYDETEELDTSPQLSATPDSKRARVE